MALNGIDFTLAAGEMTAIVGVSGSGKSTLMNILGLLDRPTSGMYQLDGVDVSSLNDNALADIRNQKIGFVFQSFFLLPRLTALENVLLPLFYQGIKRSIAKECALAMLDKLNIKQLALHKPTQLSGGQQQRVAIARALVCNPSMILADEPTGALDSQTGIEVMQLLKSLNAEGSTIVIITHDLGISSQCKRVVTIKDGQFSSDIKN